MVEAETHLMNRRFSFSKQVDNQNYRKLVSLFINPS